MTQTDEKIYHVLGLEESIMSKWLYYLKQSTDSMQPLSNYQMEFFTELEQKILKSIWKQKILNIQSNLEKEKWSWKNQAHWLQTELQSYSHQNNMVLARAHTHTHKKQKYKSMEEDRKLRNKPLHLWSINLQQRRKDDTMRKRKCLQ